MKLNAMEVSVLAKCQGEAKEIGWLASKFKDEYMRLHDFKGHIERMSSKGLVVYHGNGKHSIKSSTFGKKRLEETRKKRGAS